MLSDIADILKREHRTPHSSRRLGRLLWSILAATDLAFWVIALTGAAYLHLDVDGAKIGDYQMARVGLLASVTHLLVGLLLGLYRGRFMVGSYAEAGALGLASVLTGAAISVAGSAGLHPIPLSAGIAATGYQLTTSFALRYLVRSTRQRRHRPTGEGEPRVLVYGAGEAGDLAARVFRQDPESGVEVVGFLDDDASKRNLRLDRYRVVGTRNTLRAAAQRTHADTVLIAMPSASREVINEIADEAQALGLRVSLMPPLSRLLAGPIQVTDIREITLADFMSRDEIHFDRESVQSFLQGKRVLVTGAGGSIGAEIAETVLGFGPSALYKLDHSERALYDLEMRLHGRFQVGPTSLLANIRDGDRIMEIFTEVKPEVVFHAAAHKHVPFLERYPTEGYLTNVVGTYNVLAAAEKVGVETFVNISTDKAAEPANVLGYTKRLAERLTATVAERTTGTYMSVRFGNVLGSDGSVIATLREQLRRRQPLTITHPDVSRYFMTIKEAVQLVLQAGAVGRDGEVLVLDMGEPIRIIDLASRLAAELQPGMVPNFDFIGLRPGEKLSEVLVAEDDQPLPSDHPLLHRFRVSPMADDYVPHTLAPSLESLRHLAVSGGGGGNSGV